MQTPRSKTYSTTDAKARFAEVLRRVQDGETVYVTRHGRTVAEIRPVEPAPESFEERVARMRREGLIIPAENPDADFPIGERRPGALQRFLDSRD